MRALVNKTALVDSLAVIHQLGQPKVTIEVCGDRVRVACQSSDNRFVTSIPAVSVVEDGTAMVAVSPLKDVVALLGGDVSLAFDGKVVRTAWESFDSAFPANQGMPSLVELPTDLSDVLTIDPVTLKSACQDVIDALPDSASMMPEGALLECKTGQWALVSTDGRRMAYSTHAREGQEPFAFVVPSKAIKLLAKLPFVRQVSVGFDGRLLWFTDGTTSFATAQVAKKFPDWSRVVPTTFTWSLEVPVSQWQTALRLTAIDGRDTVVRLTTKGDVLQLLNASDQPVASMDVTQTGTLPELRVNLQYLDAATNRASQRVLLQGNGSMNPIVATNTSTSAHLLMPVKA